MPEDFGAWFSRTAQDLELLEVGLPWQAVHDLRFIAYDLVFVTADRKLLGVPGLKVLANV
jgi:hypothetical protein